MLDYLGTVSSFSLSTVRLCQTPFFLYISVCSCHPCTSFEVFALLRRPTYNSMVVEKVRLSGYSPTAIAKTTTMETNNDRKSGSIPVVTSVAYYEYLCSQWASTSNFPVLQDSNQEAPLLSQYEVLFTARQQYIWDEPIPTPDNYALSYVFGLDDKTILCTVTHPIAKAVSDIFDHLLLSSAITRSNRNIRLRVFNSCAGMHLSPRGLDTF